MPGTKGAVLDTRGMTAPPRSSVGKTEVRPWRETQSTVATWIRLMQLPGPWRLLEGVRFQMKPEIRVVKDTCPSGRRPQMCAGLAKGEGALEEPREPSV